MGKIQPSFLRHPFSGKVGALRNYNNLRKKQSLYSYNKYHGSFSSLYPPFQSSKFATLENSDKQKGPAENNSASP